MKTHRQNQQELNQSSVPQDGYKRSLKKPYSSSKLNTYGDLRNLTQAGAGSKSEVNSQGKSKKP